MRHSLFVTCAALGLLAEAGRAQEPARPPAPEAAVTPTPAPDAAPASRVGWTMDQIRTEFGAPSAQMKSGNRTIWTYERGTIEFVEGRVAVCDLLGDEELAARKSRKQQQAAEAARLQQLRAEQQTRTQAPPAMRDAQPGPQASSREYRRSVAEKQYIERQASAKRVYEEALASAKRRMDERIQNADDTYRRRGTTVSALRSFSESQSSAKQRYEADVEAAKSRFEASMAEAKTNYEADMANLDAVAPEIKHTLTIRP